MSKRNIDAVYTEQLQEHSGIKRNKKACTECRQQKVRCNATIDSKDSCSRCRRMGLNCVISDPFKREHKRQRLSELEKENYEFRRRLESNATPSIWAQMPPTPTISIETSIPAMTPVLSQGSHSPQAQVTTLVSPPAEEVDIKSPPSPTGTLTRILEGVVVSGTVLDELYQTYFREFHQFLPVIDPKLTPNEIHQRSELLFWAIAGVACRSYSHDPTLLDSLGDKIMNLALLSLRRPAISTIKGLLLMLTWPLPKTQNGHDTAYAISGSVIHMAMQIGLHIPTSAQDFSRVKVNLTETQIIKRAELWGYCILTYQRACSFKGHSPMALLETYQDSEQRHALFQRISSSLRFQLKLNGIVTRSASAMLQNGLRLMTKEQEHSLDVLIRVFEANVRDIEPEAATDIDKFYLYVSRLTVQAFHFYKHPERKLPSFMVTRMYNSACTVLQHLDHMDISGSKLTATPFYFVFSTSLASFTILRLLKASTASYMDDNAKESLFLGVNIMKRLSTGNNDGPSKMAQMLTQLWNSEKAFRNPDGTEHMALRIRTRLAMSPVFDAIWWWREEFGGQSGAYTGTGEGSHETKSSNLHEDVPFVSTQHFQPPDNTQAQTRDMTSFLDDHLLAELGWTNGSNIFYPPPMAANPYAADWYSPTDVNGFAL